MSKLLLPKTFKSQKDKLYVAQIFILNTMGEITLSVMFPPPTNGVVSGAFLSQIHANLAVPIDSMLQTALQSDEVKFLFCITELQKFREGQQRAATLQALRAQAALPTQPQAGSIDDN